MIKDNSKSLYPLFHLLSDKDYDAIKSAQSLSDLQQLNAIEKLCSDIKSLATNDQGEITAVSGNWSTLDLSSPVKFDKSCLATTLNHLIAAVRGAVKAHVAQAVALSTDQLLTCNFLGNVAFVAFQVAATKEIETAIVGKKLPELALSFRQTLESFIKASVAASKSAEKLRSSLIIDLTHRIQVVKHLIQHQVENLDSWMWTSYSRTYFEDGNAVIKQGCVCVQFGNDFIDDVSRLIITPLTVQAYHNHMGAMKHNMIMSAAGPAGTGKTETMKDLAKNLGYATCVINCSDQMGQEIFNQKIWADFKNHQIFVIFDEFNRVTKEELGNAVNFLSEAVKESPINGLQVGVTMNPGYAGRTEIPCPEKLVTIPMTVPDRQAIMGGMLSVEGFLQFENLAEYVARLLKECELYLSKECVYDFGLRMFKAIGKTAGGLLKSCEATKSEMQAVKDAILVNIVPRLTDQDCEIFKQMVENYFPKIDSNLPNCKQDWMRHTFEIRHAAFAFGEEAAALKLVKEAGIVGGYQVLEVKYENLDSFYGFFAEGDEQKWTAGAFSKCFKEASAANEKAVICITGLDATADMMACVVELLNTVMDDNKKLCLANGEEIQMGSNVRICLCTKKGNEMSPATISRTGVVRV